MNISFLSTMFPFRGGIAQFNALLYREFEKKHEVDAITFKRQYPEILFPGQTQYVTENDNPDKIKTKQWLDSINPINWIRTARRIKNTSPDLLLMKFWLPFFGPSLGYIASHLHKNTKTIAILDNVIPHEKRFFDMPFLRYFLKRVDGFIVMSEQVKRDLLSLKPNATYEFQHHPLYDHFGKPLEQKEARHKLGLDPAKKTILFFGFIREYKGLDLLIEAFEKLDDTYQLVIAGENYGSFDPYQKLIDANKNKSRIHAFVRYIDDGEVPLFFSAADVCVLPYKSATQSGITSIAYHFEVPMLATDVGGLKEMVIDGETGLIIEQPNANAIQNGIENFFNSDRATFSNNIKNRKKELSWEELYNKIMVLYNRIETE
ncbi:MAG: glycosyltransferase [Salinivirgaceae bacterium]|jgi:glycosyltransferase involved in cell wall biosynthesis|nr:glycosyltransferase [Salinivirgaceae bacterium]